MYMRMSCVNGCVVALDWYLPRTFFRSGVVTHGLCSPEDGHNDARNMLRQKLIIHI